MVGNNVEVARRIGIFVIDRWRNPLSIQRERADRRFNGAGRTERVGGVTLCSAHRNFPRVFAKNLLDLHRLGAVV